MAKSPAKKTAAPKAKKTTAPKKDAANRPLPPDRDGDGQPGGSLPGNQTDEHAKGHAAETVAQEAAEHDAAVAQIAEDGTATIIIPAFSTGNRAEHPVGVNGAIRKLKVGVEVQVSAEELAVLEASGVDYEVVTPLAAGDGAAGAEGSSSAAEPPADEQTSTVVDNGMGPDPAKLPEPTVPEGASEVTQVESQGEGEGGATSGGEA